MMQEKREKKLSYYNQVGNNNKIDYTAKCISH